MYILYIYILIVWYPCIRSACLPLNIARLDTVIQLRIAEFGSYLNPPPPFFSEEAGTAIASDIYAYFLVICRLSETTSMPLEPSPGAADAFTACMCSWLARGYPLDNPVVVEPSPFFTSYVPPDICFGLFHQFACSAMSNFQRRFRRYTISDTGCIRPGARFEFTSATLKELVQVYQAIERQSAQ